MIRIKNRNLKGSIKAVASKSVAHRHIICASLCEDTTNIKISSLSDDIIQTINCVENIGAKINYEKEILNITKFKTKNNIFDCKESGTTLRFMLPIATSLIDTCHFTGSGRLPKRPIGELIDIMIKNGVIFSNYSLPFITKNKFTFSDVEIVGNISSQYISGLLLSAPLQKDDVTIKIINKLESKPYVDITIDVMKKYGVEVQEKENTYKVAKNQKYVSPKNIVVESDWSNIAFFLVAGAISEHSITIKNVNLYSIQGDKKIIDILKQYGADVKISENSLTVSKNDLKAMDIDISQTPDLLPILSVLASATTGTTRLYGAKRLRTKESDRIKSTADMINTLGGTALEKEDELIIIGNKNLKGGIVDSQNDHRIAMSTAIASIICKDAIILKNENAINKSYPLFFEDFKKLGGDIINIIM